MALRITQKTLERLEWQEVVARVRTGCRTPQARARLGADDPDPAAEPDEAPSPAERPDLLELVSGGLETVRSRLAETGEARGILEAGDEPPLGGVADLAQAFARARKGGALPGLQLLEAASTLGALHTTRCFLTDRAEQAPLLADRASVIDVDRSLQRDIESRIDGAGQVRDDASRALRDARSEANRLSGDLQRRLARSLRDPDIAAALSDDYYTVRNDRYVLPVRADMRGKVPGIVHDASGSGTTLFVEPQAVVELNNRLKQAELAGEREALRVLHELSSRLASAAESVQTGLAMLADIDLAFARARLAIAQDATPPRVERDGVFDLRGLRHPLLPPDEAVANDLCLGDGPHVMVISGPNGGGKTVAMKSLALAALGARFGLHVPALPGARVALVDDVLADIGDDQDIRESLSTFSAHMANVASIVSAASEHSLVVLDEVGVGTDPSEGAALAQAVLEQLASRGARVIATTHYNLLKEMAAVDARFENASFEFDPETLAPTFRLHVGTPGVSSAAAVAARMGMPGEVLERAEALLEREDRRLDRMLAELASSRATLEREQHEAAQLRRQGEAVRDQYREKLERLQERRDRLYLEMREDLDRAFRDAHGQVAAVIRDLQRGGGGRDATRARERLQAIEKQVARHDEAVRPEPARDPGAPVDWRHARPGDPVEVQGAGSGVLESLPDRRGRVKVKLGAARVEVAAERVHAARVEAGRAGPPRVRVERASDSPSVVDQGLRAGGLLQCDLRGQRVAAALERVAEVLDRAARDGYDGVRIVHGIGSGALSRAVREHLRASAYVGAIRPGGEGEGGEGVTFAEMRG
ncbi:MAG: endonuclease MutS2 [Myxococcota bacterium]